MTQCLFRRSNNGNQVNGNQFKSIQVKSRQIKSNQFMSNQVKSSQIKSIHVKSSQIKSNQVKSRQINSYQVMPSHRTGLTLHFISELPIQRLVKRRTPDSIAVSTDTPSSHYKTRKCQSYIQVSLASLLI
jgi:hypothetical protein